jgi:hypothetical protein
MISRTKLRIKTTPQELREAANRLEAEMKNIVLPGQESEVDFGGSIVLYSGRAPVTSSYHSVSSEDKERHNAVSEALRSGASRPMLN